MPKEAFGGDDEGGEGTEARKRPQLSRFGLAPDTNIRDVFWKMMGSYAATKGPGMDLSAMEQDRFALMRVALSVLSRPHNESFGLSPRFIARYSLMMMLDGDWMDALTEFLGKGTDPRLRIGQEVAHSLRKLMEQEAYRKILIDYFTWLLRKDFAPIALHYIALLKNEELIRGNRKELMILARGDIGENQMNAIRAISLIKDDEDAIRSLVILLGHWDADARFAAAEALVGVENEEVRKAARKRLETEGEPDIKKLLRRLAG